ncbi:MAG: ABC transporter substrate-binding protein [Alphaproteobacteria bacterium]|nr:ABC transporter substrate-binding protein [Alphaproteobacteria bacterium]
MKKTLLLFLGLFLTSLPAKAVDTKAINFVEKLANTIITDVLKSTDTTEKKTERFEKHFLEALDTQSIGKFVLGRYWRTASHTEREQFLDAFTDMALKSWADKFDMYNGQEIIFIDARPAEGENQVYVNSQIKNDPNPVEVIWRVRNKNGTYKIVDIIIEGVSMVLSYRNEYTAYLQNHSLSELTERLKAQASSFGKKN